PGRVLRRAVGRARGVCQGARGDPGGEVAGHPRGPRGERRRGRGARRGGTRAGGGGRRGTRVAVVRPRAEPGRGVLSRPRSALAVKPILSPAESADLDRQSRDRGVTVETLMENAGRAVARAATLAVGGTYGRRAVVVCGKGNNGGDGLVAARHLTRWGMTATVVLLPDRSSLRDPSATMLTQPEAEGGRVRQVDALARELARADVAIDA